MSFGEDVYGNSCYITPCKLSMYGDSLDKRDDVINFFTTWKGKSAFYVK
jgi:hypothetical protein